MSDTINLADDKVRRIVNIAMRRVPFDPGRSESQLEAIRAILDEPAEGRDRRSYKFEAAWVSPEGLLMHTAFGDPDCYILGDRCGGFETRLTRGLKSDSDLSVRIIVEGNLK